MFKLTLRNLWSHKARVLLTTVAVVVGVAFVSGAFILTDSFEKSFNSLFQQLNQGIDFRVRSEVEFGDPGSGEPVDASLVSTLEAVPGVAAVEPGLQGSAVIVKPDGEPILTNGAPTVGTSWTGEESISGTVLREGRVPKGPTEVAIDQATFDKNGLALGDQVQVVGVSGAQPFTIVGTVGLNNGEKGFFGATLAAFDPETAQTVLGSPGKYSAIDIGIAPDADAGDVEAAIKDVLPSGVEVITGAQLAKETSDAIGQIVSIFRWVLLGFAFIALFVSAFLINNTFQIIIYQRMRELALLRAVGASGSQVRGMIVGESLVIAAVATVFGFLGGIVISKLLTLVFNAAGAGFPDASTVVEPRTLFFAFLVGFGVTLAATIVPALRASRIPPVAAMNPELARSSSGSATRRLVIGGVLTLVGAGLYLYGIFETPGGAGTIISIVAVGAVFVFLGVTMLASGLASPVSRVLGWPLSKAFKVPGQLAAVNAARTPRRTSSTAAALMIGVALVSGVGVIASSFKDSLTEQLGTSIKADWFFRDQSFQAFPAAFITDLQSVPELSSVSGVTMGKFSAAGGTRDIAAVDGEQFADILDVDVVKGSFAGLADNGLMLHDDTAKTQGLDVGDTVEVTWKNGSTTTLTVTGIFADDATIGAKWIVDQSVYRAANPSENTVMFAGARTADGVDPEAARAAIEQVGRQYPQVLVQDQAEFRKSQEDQLNQLLTIIYVLLLFAVVIAVFGIMNTLALSVFERTREFGLLRAVGTTRRQLKRAVRWEAVIVSVFGALLGLAVGLPLGIIAVNGMDSAGITAVSMPWGTVIAILLAAIVAGLLAALWPARRAAKLDVLQAIASE